MSPVLIRRKTNLRVDALGVALKHAPPQVTPVGLQLPNYVPQVPNFTVNPGIQVNTAGFTAADFFYLFFSPDFISHMVEQTNLYADQFISSHPSSSFAKPRMWTPTNPGEMKKFWGLLLNMGIIKKTTIRSYWSGDILYSTPLYATIMTRTRFETLLKFLHYNNNLNCPPRDDPSFDRFHKLKPVISHYNKKFAELYSPKKHISIDESLVLFKGRLHFRQYIPSKRSRYGIKLYKLCESESGYTHKFRVYEGKDSKIEPPDCPPMLKITGKIVWDLIYPLLDKGYHLYSDNFYTSIPLYKCLFARSTVACGTIRRNQRDLPKSFIGQSVRKGDSRAVCHENLLLIKYKDKREVHVLSSIHPDRSNPVPVHGATGQTTKPVAILDYNKHMGGVDMSDQVLQPYHALRKSRAWYKKLVLHLTQIASYNAFVLYKNAGNGGKFLQFQESVIKSLLFGQEGESSVTTVCRVVPGQHFPGVVPPTGKKSRPQKRCRVCSKQGIRKDTIYHCETCPSQPGLCINECFRIYHTSVDFC